MVKPVIFSELEEIIVKALEIRKKEQGYEEIKESYEKFYTLWEAKKPLLIERVWQDYLDERISNDPIKIEGELKEVGLTTSPHFTILPILISVEKWHKEFSSRDEEVLEYACRNAAVELVIQQDHGLAFQDHSGINIIFIYSEGTQTLSQEDWRLRCEAFILACKEYFYCSLSCYVGNWTSIQGLFGVYQNLIVMESNNVTLSNQALIYHQQFEEYDLSLKLPNFSEWGDLIEQGSSNELIHKIKEALENLKSSSNIHTSLIQSFSQGLLQMIYYFLHKNGIAATEAHNVLREHPRTLSQLEVWLNDVIQLILELLVSPKGEKTMIERVKKYMKENLTSEITREEIAESVHLNPAYLSRFFKKETGETLTDFMTNERMKMAKELLTDTDATISQIAVSLGYFHFSHFSKMFKRTYDITPYEFRKLQK
ncbi:AraC family transcriptional regulator [Paenibacillus sp. N3.4]|uniref:helix-turn-helix transcriptional regulator n=1 Tax=Paenibacillus sp. N3.4 TaxID=2603222 RepID=UPI0011C7C0F6|nr:AraC family transcriptional regulator [Paenibacillus sp. N3.4]TXK79629.1 helix-turn-helix domain-containing protein [Paenibacillus sp. N3.4]